uniref:SERPIN domain-containing protein n=2 Tax=Caenorhabditis japonica TaxID=281687 RepID=A0A8R1HHQ8_CAEJA
MSFSLINSSFVEAQFGLKLLSDQLSTAIEPCVFSPVSILLALAMVHLGAKGHTRNEIRDAIANGSTDEQFIEHFSFLNKLVNNSVNDVETLIANRLFVAPEQAIRKAFVENLHEHYNAGTGQLDFKNQENAAKIINEYISDATKGMIKDMIKADSLRDVDAMLINAVFFQGDWRSRFPAPRESNFSVSETENKLVQMMAETRDYIYNKDEDWQVVGITFKDKSAWFAIILPIERFTLSSNLKSLDATKFHNLISGVYQEYIHLTFPKFKQQYKINLKEALGKFGLSEVFTERSDLSGIGPGLQLAAATHQAVIEVDQVGTRAAAVTEAKLYFVSGRMDPPLSIRADHPFLYAIIKDNAPLFMGVYT